ncbi:MAG: mannose-6-phosphate isomerase, class I [Bifidobacteriaceae bacterium]|jgi:mannose-6-phosphate isomerase|nr:mannose-6-phosphate isomerase, class I [Bifidobacteriaceae bacterium]
MKKFNGMIKNYAWGSQELYSLLEKTGSEPFAEYWMTSEDMFSDAEKALGSALNEKTHGRMPYLFKFLAAKNALSLQVHPTAEQAKDGFAAGNKNYTDAYPKPEMLIALNETRAFIGFDSVDNIIQFTEKINTPTVTQIRSILLDQKSGLTAENKLQYAFKIALSAATLNEIGTFRMQLIMLKDIDSDMKLKRDMILQTINDFPVDRSLFTLALLKAHELMPGDASFIDAQVLHSYVSGLGIEIMSNSDNTIRAGLTNKNVDVNELLKITKFQEIGSVTPNVEQGGDVIYYIPTDDFAVALGIVQFEIKDLPSKGPRILVSLADLLQVTNEKGERLLLNTGETAFIENADAAIKLNGPGKFVLAYSPFSQNAEKDTLAVQQQDSAFQSNLVAATEPVITAKSVVESSAVPVVEEKVIQTQPRVSELKVANDLDSQIIEPVKNEPQVAETPKTVTALPQQMPEERKKSKKGKVFAIVLMILVLVAGGVLVTLQYLGVIDLNMSKISGTTEMNQMAVYDDGSFTNFSGIDSPVYQTRIVNLSDHVVRTVEIHFDAYDSNGIKIGTCVSTIGNLEVNEDLTNLDELAQIPFNSLCTIDSEHADVEPTKAVLTEVKVD